MTPLVTTQIVSAINQSMTNRACIFAGKQKAYFERLQLIQFVWYLNFTTLFSLCQVFPKQKKCGLNRNHTPKNAAPIATTQLSHAYVNLHSTQKRAAFLPQGKNVAVETYEVEKVMWCFHYITADAVCQEKMPEEYPSHSGVFFPQIPLDLLNRFGYNTK